MPHLKCNSAPRTANWGLYWFDTQRNRITSQLPTLRLVPQPHTSRVLSCSSWSFRDLGTGTVEKFCWEGRGGGRGGRKTGSKAETGRCVSNEEKKLISKFYCLMKQNMTHSHLINSLNSEKVIFKYLADGLILKVFFLHVWWTVWARLLPIGVILN